MGDAPAEPGRKDYEVGYGRPPKEHQFKKGNRANPGGRPKSKLPRIMRDYMERYTMEELERIAEDKTRPVVEQLAAVDLLDAIARSGKNLRTDKSRARVWDRMVGPVGKDDAGESDDAERPRMVIEHRFVKEKSDAEEEEEGEGEG